VSTPGALTRMVLLWVAFALQLAPVAWKEGSSYFMAHEVVTEV
jgi:putative effector of murein hydrolase LrgA (UPF0299 family)